MDVKYVNPFMEAFTQVIPQLGFGNVQKGTLRAVSQNIKCSGVIIVVGIVGAIKGNVVYCIEAEEAKKIASTMMMGMPVGELDEMSKSALSELANMLTATAATCFANIDIHIDISIPTLLFGQDIEIKMSSNKVLCIQIFADTIPIDIYIAFEK